MLIVRQHEVLQFVSAYLQAGSNQKVQVDLLFLLAREIFVHQVSIIERVLQQIDAPEHIDRFFRVETLRNVDVDCSFKENVDYHPIRLMLGFFVAAIISCQSQELKNVCAIDVF